jgi:hypothetical protein
MKWLFLICFSLFYPLNAAIHKLESLEEKLTTLEIESGIKPRPEKTSFNIFGDFLYWKASLDGVAYATTAVIVPSIAGGTVSDDFKARTVHFDYSPAFQIGAGVGLPYDHWDIAVHWLRSYSTGRDKAHGALTEAVGNRVIFESIGLIQEALSLPNKASAHCRVHLNVVDLVLGRTFLWSKYFSFRPFAGIRGTWLKLNWNIAFTAPVQPTAAFPQSSTDAKINNHFNAGGLVGGFESKWNLCQGFGFFSYATASLVYGESEEKTKQEFFSIASASSAPLEQTFTAHNASHTVKGIFDIAVGLKWERDLSKNCRILLRAGYDFFYWPSVTQKTIVQLSRIRDRADLSFQGLVVGGRLDF